MTHEDNKIEIEKVKRDLLHFQRTLDSIEHKLSNHIPTSICDLKKAFNLYKIEQLEASKKQTEAFNFYKLAQAKLSTGILVSIILMLLALLANIIISIK